MKSLKEKNMRKMIKHFIYIFSIGALLTATEGSVTLECPGELSEGQRVVWLQNGLEITEDIGKVNPRNKD